MLTLDQICNVKHHRELSPDPLISAECFNIIKLIILFVWPETSQFWSTLSLLSSTLFTAVADSYFKGKSSDKSTAGNATCPAPNGGWAKLAISW